MKKNRQFTCYFKELTEEFDGHAKLLTTVYAREPELRIGYQLIINDPREGGQLIIN